jgi:hypothetical protein
VTRTDVASTTNSKQLKIYSSSFSDRFLVQLAMNLYFVSAVEIAAGQMPVTWRYVNVVKQLLTHKAMVRL